MKKSSSFYKIDIYVLISNLLSISLMWYFLIPINDLLAYYMVLGICTLNLIPLFYNLGMKTQENKIWSALNYLIVGLFVVNIFIFLYVEIPDANIIIIIFILAIIIAIPTGTGKGLADRKKIEIGEKTKHIYNEAYAKESEDWNDREAMIRKELLCEYEKKIDEERKKIRQEMVGLQFKRPTI